MRGFLKYECQSRLRSLHELVKDGLNGLVFKNASQLAEQLEVGGCLYVVFLVDRVYSDALYVFSRVSPPQRPSLIALGSITKPLCTTAYSLTARPEHREYKLVLGHVGRELGTHSQTHNIK
jgi:hypothetical protein